MGRLRLNQDSVSSSVNGGDNGICTENKQAQDPAPHLGLGHVKPSDSTVAPSPSPGPEVWGRKSAAWYSRGPEIQVPQQPQKPGPHLQSGDSTRAVSEACADSFKLQGQRNSATAAFCPSNSSAKPSLPAQLCMVCALCGSASFSPALCSCGPSEQPPHSPASHPAPILQPEGSPKALTAPLHVSVCPWDKGKSLHFTLRSLMVWPLPAPQNSAPASLPSGPHLSPGLSKAPGPYQEPQGSSVVELIWCPPHTQTPQLRADLLS